MKKAKRTSFASIAVLAALLFPALARAAVYELASEWMTVSFKDGDKDVVLFTHLPDSDIFMHMQEYSTVESSTTHGLDISVPLQQLVQTDTGTAAGIGGAEKSLILTGRPTPYKMLIRFDRVHQHHIIQRPPDFTTRDSTTSATILSVFGVKTEHPDNFLVMVKPERPASAADGLSDIELAVVNSLDASERTTLVGQCGGEPGAPAALKCWHDQIGVLLNRHQAETASSGLTPFDQRYIQNRLSPKGYEQFQSLRSSSADGGDKLSLASSIFNQDMAANAAAAAKAAPAVATASAAAIPAIPQAAPKTKASLNKPAVVPVAAAVQQAPAANPEPTPAKTPMPWKKMLLALLALAVVAAIVASR